MYQRACPKCSLSINYSNCRSFDKASKGNSLCKVCAGLGRFTADYTGQRFGRLVVIRRVLPSPLPHSSAWLVKCDCGSPERVVSGNLKNRTGCGCWRPLRRRFTDKEKWCGVCEKSLPLDDFGMNRSTISGRADSCKVCFKKSQTIRDNLRKYNLSPEGRAALEEKQGGKCAICRKIKKLCVDHNHATGFVRGLLCVSCNAMLGRLNEDVTSLERAIQYLKAEFAKPVVGEQHGR
jgi:Recombination endonuclease VII